MKTIFTTADYRPQDRFDSWHAAARLHVVDHDSQPDHRMTFDARLQVAALEEITLISFESSAMNVTHSVQHAAQASDELLVCRPLGGVLMFEQNDRQVVLKRGDLTLLDPRLPYRGRLFANSNVLVVKVPRRRLEARVGRTENMVARGMRRSQGENALVSELFGLLPICVEQISQSASTVAEQALDLLAIALTASMADAGPKVSSTRFLLATRLRSVIEARLIDPELSPADVAAAAGVSVRYANAVLADEETSLARLIQTRRLEKCHRALSDGSQAHRSISDIAYGWGFSDMTHFGRIFRRSYGMLPSEFRRSF